MIRISLVGLVFTVACHSSHDAPPPPVAQDLVNASEIARLAVALREP